MTHLNAHVFYSYIIRRRSEHVCVTKIEYIILCLQGFRDKFPGPANGFYYSISFPKIAFTYWCCLLYSTPGFRNDIFDKGFIFTKPFSLSLLPLSMLLVSCLLNNRASIYEYLPTLTVMCDSSSCENCLCCMEFYLSVF